MLSHTSRVDTAYLHTCTCIHRPNLLLTCSRDLQRAHARGQAWGAHTHTPKTLSQSHNRGAYNGWSRRYVLRQQRYLNIRANVYLHTACERKHIQMLEERRRKIQKRPVAEIVSTFFVTGFFHVLRLIFRGRQSNHKRGRWKTIEESSPKCWKCCFLWWFTLQVSLVLSIFHKGWKAILWHDILPYYIKWNHITDSLEHSAGPFPQSELPGHFTGPWRNASVSILSVPAWKDRFQGISGTRRVSVLGHALGNCMVN